MAIKRRESSNAVQRLNISLQRARGDFDAAKKDFDDLKRRFDNDPVPALEAALTKAQRDKWLFGTGGAVLGFAAKYMLK